MPKARRMKRPIEGAPTADAAVHEDVLEELQLVLVVLVVLRSVPDVGPDRGHVAPAVVGGGDVVGAVVAEHLAAPGEDLIRLLAIDDHAVVPGAQILEGRIELAVEEGLLEVEVALDRVDGRGRIGLGHRVALLDGDRVFQADRQRQPLQRAFGRLVAGLPDVAVDLHRLAVLAILGAVRDGHLHQQIVVGQHLLDQLLLLLRPAGRTPPDRAAWPRAGRHTSPAWHPACRWTGRA